MGSSQLTASSFSYHDIPPEFIAPPAEHPTDADHDIEILRSIPGQFQINDAATANWLARKVQEARAHADRTKLWAEREIARAAREERVLLHLFGKQLERWARAEIAKLNGRRKSISLPDGTLSFRTVNPKLVVDDDRLVIDWAREHLPQAIIPIEKLSKSVLNECVEKTGVIPNEGAHVEPGGERFSIR